MDIDFLAADMATLASRAVGPVIAAGRRGRGVPLGWPIVVGLAIRRPSLAEVAPRAWRVRVRMMPT